ncbi:MAG: MBL fold metallo-hydrolase [bacterium]
MDISYLGKSNFKIKTKTGSVVAGPDKLVVSHRGEGDEFIIREPGEYEVEGISVFGFQAEGARVYVVQFEDIRVLYLDSLTKPLGEKVLTELDNIDVVVVPTDTMNLKDILDLVAKLEPYYVLPFGEATSKFITAYEHGSRTVKSLNLSKLTLSEDLTEVIVFE